MVVGFIAGGAMLKHGTDRDDSQDREGGGPFGLPDLAQVTGWSRSHPGKAPNDARRALFGGWRIGDMAAKLRGG